jgi:Rod binding domain-containing protein
MSFSVPATGSQSLRPPLPPDHDKQLMKVARELEASFLTEMLKSAGVGKSREVFGGGAGEDHFSSFLVQEYAKSTVQAGGIGLSESIYRSLVQTMESTT